MTSATFRFSPAAKLYCQHVDLVDQLRNAVGNDAQELYQSHRTLISQMRDEVYLSIATFGKVLLDKLASEQWEQQGLTLCEKTTYTTKSYAGTKIHYRWLEPISQGGRPGLGCIYVFFPIPEKIQLLEDDSKLRDCFEMLTRDRLTVRIYSNSPDASQRKSTVDLAHNTEFGTFEEVNREGTRSILWMPLSGEDPVSSVHTRLVALLRSIHAIDFPH